VATCVAKIQRAPARLPFKKHLIKNWQLLLLAPPIELKQIATAVAGASNRNQALTLILQLLLLAIRLPAPPVAGATNRKLLDFIQIYS